MFRKDEKKALTRLALLSIGWPAGLDRFYEGKVKDGLLSIIGWALVFGSIIALSPCHNYDYVEGTKQIANTVISPLILIPFGFGLFGCFLILKKGFRLLRQFESAE